MSVSSPPALGELQRWFRAVVMQPGGLAAGLASTEAQRHLKVAPADLETIVCPSAQQSSAERLAIYQRGYTLRLLECMRATYPALRHALGVNLFDDFALDYLYEHPSRTYTLLALDEQFPEHLAATRPDADAVLDGDVALGADEPWPDFIVDLARLERLVSDVFDGPGLERQPGGWQPPVLPREGRDGWLGVRIEPAPSLRILGSTYPVGRYLLDVYRGQAPALPRAEPTFLALSRRDYVVQLYELTEASYRVLECLMAGETLESSGRRAAVPIDGTAWGWFRSWTESGLFARVSVSGQAGPKPREVA